MPRIYPEPRAVLAVQHLRVVLVPRRGGAVGVEDQGPALAVDDNLVVIETQEDEVFGAGLAAVGLVPDVVDLARRRGLVAAAGPPAVLVAQDDRVANAGRDGLGVADVQRQAGAAQPHAQLAAAQEAGEAAGTR